MSPGRKVTLTLEELRNMYWAQRMNTRQIAEKYGVWPEAVRHWMVKYGIPRRNRYEATIKYPRKPFSGDEYEKAYLLGLRAGDIHARKRATNTVGVNVSTTSPAMIELFETTFRGYGFVKKYPAKGPLVYEWYVYCDLDRSFEFLIEKPVEVSKNNGGFYAFLAGYVDSEGTWTFSYQNDRLRLHFWIKSQDIKLLNEIKKKLENDGFHPSGPHLRVKGGTSTSRLTSNGKILVTNSKDYFQLDLCKRDEIVRLAKKLVLFSRHKEKMGRMRLVLEAVEERLTKEKIKNFIEAANIKTKECVKVAELGYLYRHSNKASFLRGGVATRPKELRTYAQLQGDECYYTNKMG